MKRLVLIVDDEPDICWALEKILRDAGIDSQKALSGKEALTAMKKNIFRLVFLDVKLTDIDGLELAKRIQEIDSSICIVMISGYYYKEDFTVKKALHNGLISGFISKPFRNKDIIQIIKMAGIL
jgi:DNA-binding NtrC family response regulator